MLHELLHGRKREPLDERAVNGTSTFQFGGDLGELFESGFQVLGDLKRDHVRIGQVGGVFQALVFEPEDIEARLVALDEFL